MDKMPNVPLLSGDIKETIGASLPQTPALSGKAVGAPAFFVMLMCSPDSGAAHLQCA